MEAHTQPVFIPAERQRQQIAPEGYFFIGNISLSKTLKYDNIPEAQKTIRDYERRYPERFFLSALVVDDEGNPLDIGEAIAVYIKPADLVELAHIKRAATSGSFETSEVRLDSVVAGTTNGFNDSQQYDRTQDGGQQRADIETGGVVAGSEQIQHPATN